MEVIFVSVKWQHALVYVEDVIILSKTPKDHLKNIDEGRVLLMEPEVTIKHKKSQFYSRDMHYLDHVIEPGKLQVARQTVEAIKAQKYRFNIAELRSIQGVCKVYQRFVPIFASLAGPLNKGLKKGEHPQFDLDTVKRDAVDVLKEKLIAPQEQALSRNGKMHTVQTDTCDVHVACVLIQKQKNEMLKPVGHWSRSICNAETL